MALSWRARRRLELADVMEGGPDETRFTHDAAGVRRRLDGSEHVIDELADYDVAEGELGYSVRNLPAGHGVPDDNDGPGSDLLSDTTEDTETDPDERITMAISEKTPAELKQIHRTGDLMYPDKTIAIAVKEYMAANGGTFQDALTAVKAADPEMFRAYARWVVRRRATKVKTRDALADLAAYYKAVRGEHLMAEILAEGERDNSAALAHETSKFLAEHPSPGGLAGIDAARSYLRIKRPDLFEAEPDERS